MWLLDIKNSTRKNKKLKATFCLCEKKNACKGSNHDIVHFGQRGSETFIDGEGDGDLERKRNYIARHEKRENWNVPISPASLSRWLLWGPSTSITKNIAAFKKRFNV